MTEEDSGQRNRAILRTGISKAMWCNPADTYRLAPARIPVMSSHGSNNGQVAWLDQILDGGLVLPTMGGNRDRRALTVLLSGPPGTGKSTLALELCYRWSFPQVTSAIGPLQSLYLTSEAHVPWMRSNAAALGWDQIDSRIVTDPVNWQSGKILVFDAADSKVLLQHLEPFLPDGHHAAGRDHPRFWEDLHCLFFPEANEHLNPKSSQLCARSAPDVVVIDSLNTLPKQADRENLFQNFLRLVGAGPKVLIAVLNSSADPAIADFWEFAMDVVIRLDRRYAKSGYLVRTIEIVKARYQEHAFGKHQLKTHQRDTEGEESSSIVTEFDSTYQALRNGKLPDESKTELPNRLRRYAERAAKLMRAHPYRSANDGGLVIFPSIHYVLSRYKRAMPTEAGKSIPSAIKNLTSILHKGYPRARCTALIGDRGGHKSHLAYVELIDRLIHGEKALVVSLRDDEGVTRQTMEKILKNRWSNPDPRLQLLKWEAEGQLDLTYYPPGYITPEEFFHRLMLSINRIKSDARSGSLITFLFNSLDQLSSRFPLCVEEEVFVPGIVQMLSGEGISSFFVAAEEETRPDYYGLQTMAELILDFRRELIPREQMLRLVGQSVVVGPSKQAELQSRYGDMHQAVVVSVVRHAGGQAAGAKAVLELAEKGDPLSDLCGETDLVALPFVGWTVQPDEDK